MNRVKTEEPKDISIDFETYYDDECSVATLGIVKYCLHPDFVPYLVAIKGHNGDEVIVEDPAKVNWKQFEGKGHTFVAHNASFDQFIAEKYLQVLVGEKWECTADLAAFSGLPRSLAFAVKQAFDIKVSKDPRSNAKGKMPKDFSPAQWREFVDYAKYDAIHCLDLWEKYSDEWPEFERKISNINRQMGWTGIKVDQGRVTGYIETLTAQVATEKAKIEWVGKPCPSGRMISKAKGPIIAGEGSKYAKVDYCERMKVPVPETMNQTSPEWAAWLEKYGDKAPALAAVSLSKKISKHLTTFETIKRRLVDGIFSYDKLYYGAHTGRYSGAGGMNMENLPRKPKYGTDTRSCFIPREGYTFGVFDFAQIEPRILHIMVEDWKFIERVASGINPYQAHAENTMGWTGGKLADENPDLYTLAKARGIMLGYQVGGGRFQASADEIYGFKMTLDEANRQVFEFRRDNPLITGLWKTLTEMAHEAAREGKEWELELPSGRSLRFFNIHWRRNDFGKQELVAWTVKGGRRKTPNDALTRLYGGLLTENICQAIGRDILVKALARVIDADYRALLTVHDEVIVELPKDSQLDTRMKDVQRLMEIPPSWMPNIPLEAEGKIVERYCK